MIFEEESNCLSHDFYLTPQYISTEQKHGKNHTFLFLRIREEGSNKVRRIKFGEQQKIKQLDETEINAKHLNKADRSSDFKEEELREKNHKKKRKV